MCGYWRRLMGGCFKKIRQPSRQTAAPSGAAILRPPSLVFTPGAHGAFTQAAHACAASWEPGGRNENKALRAAAAKGGAAPPTGVKGKAAGNARRGEKKAVARGRKTTGHHTFFALGVPQRRQPQGLTKPGIAAVSVAAAAATSRATEHPRTFRGKRRFRDGRAANTPARMPGCSRKNLLRPVWSAAYICAAGQQAKRGQASPF